MIANIKSNYYMNTCHSGNVCDLPAGSIVEIEDKVIAGDIASVKYIYERPDKQFGKIKLSRAVYTKDLENIREGKL